MRAVVEAHGTGQGVLDEAFRRLRLGDPLLEDGDVAAEQLRMIHRVARVQHLAQLPQAEAGLLAHEDHRHSGQVGVSVPALPARGTAGGEQTHAFPMTQDVGGQPEPTGQITDGQIRVRPT